MPSLVSLGGLILNFLMSIPNFFIPEFTLGSNIQLRPKHALPAYDASELETVETN